MYWCNCRLGSRAALVPRGWLVCLTLVYGPFKYKFVHVWPFRGGFKTSFLVAMAETPRPWSEGETWTKALVQGRLVPGHATTEAGRPAKEQGPPPIMRLFFLVSEDGNVQLELLPDAQPVVRRRKRVTEPKGTTSPRRQPVLRSHARAVHDAQPIIRVWFLVSKSGHAQLELSYSTDAQPLPRRKLDTKPKNSQSLPSLLQALKPPLLGQQEGAKKGREVVRLMSQERLAATRQALENANHLAALMDARAAALRTSASDVQHQQQHVRASHESNMELGRLMVQKRNKIADQQVRARAVWVKESSLLAARLGAVSALITSSVRPMIQPSKSSGSLLPPLVRPTLSTPVGGSHPTPIPIHSHDAGERPSLAESPRQHTRKPGHLPPVDVSARRRTAKKGLAETTTTAAALPPILPAAPTVPKPPRIMRLAFRVKKNGRVQLQLSFSGRYLQEEPALPTPLPPPPSIEPSTSSPGSLRTHRTTPPSRSTVIADEVAAWTEEVERLLSGDCTLDDTVLVPALVTMRLDTLCDPNDNVQNVRLDLTLLVNDRSKKANEKAITKRSINQTRKPKKLKRATLPAAEVETSALSSVSSGLNSAGDQHSVVNNGAGDFLSPWTPQGGFRRNEQHVAEVLDR